MKKIIRMWARQCFIYLLTLYLFIKIFLFRIDNASLFHELFFHLSSIKSKRNSYIYRNILRPLFMILLCCYESTVKSYYRFDKI